MLELIWPGKTASAALSVSPTERLWASWTPAPSEHISHSQCDSIPHRIIAADNLEAMKLLRSEGAQYDVIYIDPPYNTGSALTYKDKLARSSGSTSAAWLDIIYPRMLLARDLLAQTGVMFVSIDDNEACHLLTLLREIFGSENHLGTIKWRRKRKPSFLDSHLSATLEYVVVFAKDVSRCPRLLGLPTEETTRPVLNAGNKDVERIIPAGMAAMCADGFYQAGPYKNRSLSFTLLDPLHVKDARVESETRVVGPFRIHQQLWAETGFITKNFGLRRRVLPSEQKRRHAEDDGTAWATNEDAQAELKHVFGGERIFDFPKPVGLLTELLSMVPQCEENRPLRCLDFYAGTGTFLIAALEQTRKDGVERTVDLVQSREEVRGDAAQRFTDIAEICAYRVCVDSRIRGFSPLLKFLQLPQ